LKWEWSFEIHIIANLMRYFPSRPIKVCGPCVVTLLNRMYLSGILQGLYLWMNWGVDTKRTRSTLRLKVCLKYIRHSRFVYEHKRPSLWVVQREKESFTLTSCYYFFCDDNEMILFYCQQTIQSHWPPTKRL
jgi:hypothetical protein